MRGARCWRRIKGECVKCEDMAKHLEKSIFLVNEVRRILERRNSVATNKSTLLAISGGQDSACLTAVAVQMQQQWSSSFGVVSCNHLWQQDSFHGGAHVCRLAFHVHWPLYFATPPLHIVNEAGARSWRYNSIQRIGHFYCFSTICAGHTASDRIETVLFNLIRGSGTRGLSALGWSRFFVTAYPRQYHLSNFEGTGCAQTRAFFEGKSLWSSSLASKPHRLQHLCMLSRLSLGQRVQPRA